MVNISRIFLASIRTLSNTTPNPEVVYEAMRRVFKTSLEYKHSIYVKRLYTRLRDEKISTTTVQELSQKLCRTLPNYRKKTLIGTINRWKLADAHTQLRKWERKNTETWRSEGKIIRENNLMEEYKRLWRREITKIVEELKEQEEKKVRHLTQKYGEQRNRNVEIPNEIQGITVAEQNLGEDFSSSPRTYGGTILDDNERLALSLPTKFTTYEKVEKEQTEAEIEKALAKVRWEDNRKRNNDSDEPPTEETPWKNRVEKTMNFQHLRSTHLPFNRRIVAPGPLDDQTEICLQSLKMKLNACTERYLKQQKTQKKASNMTKEEYMGLKSIKQKSKNNEILIFETDKSKRFSCDTAENYQTLGQTHTMNDEEVNRDTVELFEKNITAHAVVWTRFLDAGNKTNTQDKILSNMRSQHNPPAPLSILRKDHKQYDSEEIGPPGRPVCGGDVSYNKRLSHLISLILTEVYVHEKTVCSSTEELLAEMDKLNENGIDASFIVGSMDVEALYPSLDVEFTIAKVCELFYESNIQVNGINYKELGLYLSLTHTDEELIRKGIHESCPKRKHRRGQRPTITQNGMMENDEKRYGPWVFPDISTMDDGGKRTMLTEAMRTVLKVLLETHTYEFAGTIRRQTRGGPIGMEITGVIAQVFMVWWDREFRKRLDTINIQLPLHERYVDDSNVGTEETEVGARYNGERLVVTEESRNEDADLEADKRTMLLLQKVANSIHPTIRVTIDFPSNHVDGKVPMLNIKSWVETTERRTRIKYEHYEKEMATKAVMHARSAVPEQMKRTVLTQELLRRFVNCSRDLPWERVSSHANDFMKKLQFSGYDHKFRYDVVKSAIHAYETIKQRADAGIRPINRPKEWKRDEHMKNKTIRGIEKVDSTQYCLYRPHQDQH